MIYCNVIKEKRFRFWERHWPRHCIIDWRWGILWDITWWSARDHPLANVFKLFAMPSTGHFISFSTYCLTRRTVYSKAIVLWEIANMSQLPYLFKFSILVYNPLRLTCELLTKFSHHILLILRKQRCSITECLHTLTLRPYNRIDPASGV